MARAFGCLRGQSKGWARFAATLVALLCVSACDPAAQIRTEPIANPAAPVASLGIVIIDKPLKSSGLDLFGHAKQINQRRVQLMRVMPAAFEKLLQINGIEARAIVSAGLQRDQLSRLAKFKYILVLEIVRAELTYNTKYIDTRAIWFSFAASLIEQPSGQEIWRATNIKHLAYHADLADIFTDTHTDAAAEHDFYTTAQNILIRMANDGYLANLPRVLSTPVLAETPPTPPAPVTKADQPSTGAASDDVAQGSIAFVPSSPSTQTPTPAESSAIAPLPDVAGFKAPPVGTRIYPDAGGYFEVISVDGATVQTVNAALQQTLWIGPFVVPGADPHSIDWRQLERIWPLAVGKSTSFIIPQTSANGVRAGWQEKLAVLRQEDITTDAGQFQTFVVETRERSLAGDSQTITTAWYAPAVGFVVKYRRDVEAGSGRSLAWTAARIITPGS